MGWKKGGFRLGGCGCRRDSGSGRTLIYIGIDIYVVAREAKAKGLGHFGR